MLAALARNGETTRSFVDPESGLALGRVARPEPARPGDPSPEWHESDHVVVALEGIVASDPEHRAAPARSVARTLEADETGFPAGLHGQFGLAAWSSVSRTLRLARDPLGAGDLYWFHDPATGLAVFSSELKGLVGHPAVPRRVDPEALAALLAIGYLPAPLCPFRDVHKMFAGEVVELDRRGRAAARRYWTMPAYAPRRARGDELAAEARQLVLDRFACVVDGQERIGVFLSGGVDSTIALGVLDLIGIPELPSFAFGSRIGPARYAEDLAWAKRAADARGAPFHPVVIEPGHDPVPRLEEVWRHFDDPVLSPNAYTRFLLAEAAHRDHVPMCVGGSTAGSLFGTNSDESVAKMIRKSGATSPPALLAHRFNRIFPFDEIGDLLAEPPESPGRIGLDLAERYCADIDTDSVGEVIKLAMLRIAGAEKSTATQNRSARLAGVNVRHPFRDVAILEFSRTIPIDLKGRRDPEQSKHLLKRAFRDVLPAEIAAREKIGYPSYYWTGGEIDSLAETLLSPRAVERAGLFRPDRVQQILDEDRASGKKSAGKRTWALLTMQAWHAFYIEGRASLV
jgi:asparagine synthase (glutamine-hydrolysing)